MSPDRGELTVVRAPLSRARVLGAALALADAEGLDAVTMRGVAAALDVEAMSLYHHVANKEAVLDGLVELVVEECHDEVAHTAVPDPALDWRGAVRARILAARVVMLRHPWVTPIVETRTSVPLPVLRWYDQLLAALRAGGFSWDLAHHAMHAIGSRGLGFAQELFQPAPGAEDEEEVDLEQMATTVPNLVAMLGEIVHDDPDTTLGWCDDQAEFEFGLDVLLEGLQHRLARDA